MSSERYAATWDFYETPAWAVRAIVPHLPSSRGVLDPCAGKGAILQVLEHEAEGRFTALRGLEINEAHRGSHGFPTVYGDALDPAVSWGAPRLVVTNPPFHVAQEILVRALAEIRPGGTIAALLRLGFLASSKRRDFHRAHPSDVHVLSDRPSFCVTITCSNKRDCGWRVMLGTDEARPRKCGSCSGEVRTSTSDASEYAWLVWGPGRGGRWSVLPGDAAVPEPAVLRALSAQVEALPRVGWVWCTWCGEREARAAAARCARGRERFARRAPVRRGEIRLTEKARTA